MRQFLYLLSLCAILLAVTSCATYQPHDLHPATTEAAFRDRTLNDPGLQKFILKNRTTQPFTTTQPSQWPPRQFDLNALTLAALYFHPDLEMARAKLASAEAAMITAGARPNPTFAFSPTYSEPPIEFFNAWTLGFTLDVPIETAGKRNYRIAQARELANSARLDLAGAAWQVCSRVRSALLDLYGANLTQQVLSQQQAVQDRTVRMLEDRLRAGQSSLFEVQLVRVAAAKSTLQFRDAQRQSHQARARLASALGLPTSALTNISLSFAAFDEFPGADDSAAYQRQALRTRPDILRALAEYAASQVALQLEIARQYPDVHLGPGYTWNQGVPNYSLGVSLTLPLLDQNQGPIAEAQAHRRQAAAAFAALQERAISDLDTALVGYRDARAKLQTAEVLLSAQRQRMQSMRESFTAGAADRLELLQTQLELHGSELARAGALIEAQQALGLLEDAMERPADALGKSASTVPSSNPKSE